MVWPIPFLFDMFAAHKGSVLFLFYIYFQFQVVSTMNAIIHLAPT